MKTLLEEKNHMRKLMGLSLLSEQNNKKWSPDDPYLEELLKNDKHGFLKGSLLSTKQFEARDSWLDFHSKDLESQSGEFKELPYTEIKYENDRWQKDKDGNNKQLPDVIRRKYKIDLPNNTYSEYKDENSLNTTYSFDIKNEKDGTVYRIIFDGSIPRSGFDNITIENGVVSDEIGKAIYKIFKK